MDLRLQIDAVTTVLDSLLSKEAQKSILLARQRMYEFGNKASKYFVNLVKARAGSQAIPVIKDRSGRRVYGNECINTSFLQFYKHLYNSESDCNSETLMNIFFRILTFLKHLKQRKCF